MFAACPGLFCHRNGPLLRLLPRSQPDQCNAQRNKQAPNKQAPNKQAPVPACLCPYLYLYCCPCVPHDAGRMGQPLVATTMCETRNDGDRASPDRPEAESADDFSLSLRGCLCSLAVSHPPSPRAPSRVLVSGSGRSEIPRVHQRPRLPLAGLLQPLFGTPLCMTTQHASFCFQVSSLSRHEIQPPPKEPFFHSGIRSTCRAER